MARIQKQFSFESDEQYQRFLDLALRYQLLHQGNPSASGLAQAIADKILWIFDPSKENPKDSEIDVLVRALWLISDMGNVEICLKIIEILKRYEIPLPLLQEAIRIQLSIKKEWIEKVQVFLNQQQPFTMSYRSSSGESKNYTVVFGKLEYIERHRYLVAKILTNKLNEFIPELSPNRTFRLDRLRDVEVAPNAAITWEPGLATILVKFALLGDWARSYEAKPEDVEVSFGTWEDGNYCKIVSRRVSNWFFFQREVLRYGRRCVVMEPPDAKNLMLEEITKMAENYEHSLI